MEVVKDEARLERSVGVNCAANSERHLPHAPVRQWARKSLHKLCFADSIYEVAL